MVDKPQSADNESSKPSVDCLLVEYQTAQDSAQHHDHIAWTINGVVWGASLLLLGFVVSAIDRPSARFVIRALAVLGVILTIASWRMWLVLRNVVRQKYQSCKDLESLLGLTQHSSLRYPVGTGRFMFSAVLLVFIATWLFVLASTWWPLQVQSNSNQVPDFASQVMESTVAIQSRTVDGDRWVGTALVVKLNCRNLGSDSSCALITARHVLESIPGEEALLVMHRRDENYNWVKAPVTVKIRSRGRELWRSLDDFDIAALPFSPFLDLTKEAITVEQLATREVFMEEDFIPGTQVFCAAYPRIFWEQYPEVMPLLFCTHCQCSPESSHRCSLQG